MPDLRVVVVAADPLARRGLAALLGREPGLTVAGQLAGDVDDVRLEVLRGRERQQLSIRPARAA